MQQQRVAAGSWSRVGPGFAGVRHSARDHMTTSKNWMPGVATNWGMGVTDQLQPQAKGENGMEDWAAKARAWATAKSAQEAAIAQVQAQYQQQQQLVTPQEHLTGYYSNEWQQHQGAGQGQGQVQGQGQGQGQGGFPRHGEQQIRPSYGGHEAPPPSYSQDWEAWNSRPWQDLPLHPHAHPLAHSHLQATVADQQHQHQQAFHDYPPPHQPLQPQSLPQQPASGPGYNHDLHMDFSQDSSTYPHDLPASAYDMDTSSNFAHDAPPSSYAQDSASTSYKQPSSGLVPVISSTYSQDASSSFGLESGTAVPPGTELQDRQQHPAMPPTSVLPQHQQLAPSPSQTQPPPHSQQSQQQVPPSVPMPLQQQPQQQQFPYSYPPMPSYELQPHQQFDFQPVVHAEYAQQPPPQFISAVSTIGIDGPDVGYGAPPPMQGWPPMGAPGMSFPSAVGINIPSAPGGPQFEHLHHHQQPHTLQPPHVFARPPGPSFRPSGPPLAAPFGFGPNSSIGSIPGTGVASMLPGDVNGNMAALDRPKKAAVPSWLREELIKKKAAAVSGNSVTLSTPEEVLGNGVVPNVNRKPEHVKSDSSGASDAEDEDEDEAEAARTAAINYEIKRILTEILLKVTQDIFDEIAQEVVDEDDESVSEVTGAGIKVSEIARQVPVQSLSPPAPLAASAAARVVVALNKPSQPSSEEDTESLSSGAPTGNLLGLATYASDDDERSSVPAAGLSKLSGPDSNGELKERNHRWKADVEDKPEEYIRGESKDRTSKKAGRMEARGESKRTKRPLDEGQDVPSPRRVRLSQSVDQNADPEVAVVREEIASQNHVGDTIQEQQGVVKLARGGLEPFHSGEHDTKTSQRSRNDHANSKEYEGARSKLESKREAKIRDTSNRIAEKLVAGHGQDSAPKEKVPKGGDTVRRDLEHADRRETLREHDSTPSRKRDGHRDQEKAYAKDAEKVLERERKSDQSVVIDRYNERSKGQHTRSERDKRRSDKEMDSKSRDRQRDGRERRESRDSRRRRRRSSSTGSRGRSRSTNY